MSAVALWTLIAATAGGSGAVQAASQSRADAHLAAQHVDRGLNLLKGGKPHEALAEFQQACQEDPRSVRALVLAGIAENELGQAEEGASVLRRALRLDPHSQAAHYNLALSLAQLKQYNEAIGELRRVLKLNPRFGPASYNLGVLLEKRGDPEGAIEAFQTAREAQPGDPAIVTHLIAAFYMAGKRAQALSLAREAASRNSAADFASQVGLLLIEHNDIEEAIRLLESQRPRAAATPDFTLTLARAYIAAGQPQKGIDLLKTIPAADSSWQSAELTGLAYVSLNNPPAALAAFREAVRLAPAQPKAHLQLGKLLLSSSRAAEQDEGVKEVSRAISLEPQEVENYRVLAEWFLRHDYVKPALEVLEQGIHNAPPSAGLEALMALAQASLHGGIAARPFAERALQLAPRLALAHYLVGFAHFTSGDYEGAVKYYREAIEIDSGNAVFFYNTAVALERLNRNAEALPYAEKAAALRPERGLYHYLLGKLYRKLQRDRDALRELETSLRLNPQLASSYYLLLKLYNRAGDTTRAAEMRAKLAELKVATDNEVKLSSKETESEREIPPSQVLEGRGP